MLLIHKAKFKTHDFGGLRLELVLGIGWISYIEALKVVPVSTAGVIYMTYPIFHTVDLHGFG